MNKSMGLIAAALGTVLLLIGLSSDRWLVGTDFGIETRVGLLWMTQCQEVRPVETEPGSLACSKTQLDDIANTPSAIEGFDTFRLVAFATAVAGLLCAAMTILLGALALLKKHPYFLFIAPSTIGLLFSFGTLVLVAITMGVHPWKTIGWGTGPAYVLAGGGAILCMVAALALGRLRAPDSDDF